MGTDRGPSAEHGHRRSGPGVSGVGVSGVGVWPWSASRVAAMMVVGLAMVVIAHLSATHDKAIRDAGTLLSALANSLEQTIGGSIRGLDSLLEEVSAAVEAGDDRNGRFTEDLLIRLPAFPELRYIGVVDIQGVMRPQTWPDIGIPGGGQDVSDRQYFLAQKDAAGDSRLAVGEPVVGRVTQGRSVHLSRPLRDEDGRFQGIVAGAINPDVYAEAMRSIRTDDGMSCAVIGLDGHILAHAPAQAQRFGADMSGSDLFAVHLPRSPVGVAELMADGVDSLIGYRVIGTYELVATCGVARAQALVDWHRMAVWEILLAGAFSVAVVWWAGQTDLRRRLLRRYDADLEQAVVERTAQLADARQLAEHHGDRLASLNLELKRLAMVAAHHLQEPVRSVVSFAQLTRRHLRDLNPEVAAELARIGADGVGLKTVLSQFQEHVFALENASDITPVDCEMVVRLAASRIRQSHPRTMPHVVLERLPSLSLPAGIVHEIFTHLFDLAARCGAPGMIGTLTVTAERSGASWLFRITDDRVRPNGGGGTTEPYTNLAAALVAQRETAACWAIVESLGGHIWTEPSDRGPCVCFALAGWSETSQVVPAPPAMLPDAPVGSSDFVARGIALAMIAGLVSGAGLQLKLDHDAAIRAAEALTGAMVNTIEQHVGASVRSIDSLVSEVALAVGLDRQRSAEFTRRVQARLRQFPEIQRLVVVDGQGRVVLGTWPGGDVPSAGLDDSERDYFRQLAQSDGPARLLVGQPMVGRVTGERTVPLTRPVKDQSDRFAGVVVALVNPDIYAQFLESLLLDEQGASAVIGLDGRMLARAPAHAEKFGMNIANSDLFTIWLPRAAFGIAPLISKADGNDKFVGYKIVRGYPMVVTSAISRAKALHEWSGMAMAEAWGVAGVSLVIFLWAWQSDRQGGRLRRHLAALERVVDERTADLAAANRTANDRAVGLARVNEALRHLSELATHQLGGPARAIAARSQSLSERLRGHGGDAEALVEFIRSASLHLTALIRDFQRYSTVCSNSPNVALVSTRSIAEDAACLVLAAAGHDCAHIDIAELPTVPADGGMVLEVFLQLFSNAVRHRGDRPAVNIHVGARLDADVWIFSVADDGPGIAAEIRDRVLQVFEAVHGRAPDSTGLGLPLCRIIIQAHGGRIWLDSSDDGTVIYFTVPRAPAI